MQNKFSFVLVNPQLGENIGSCARALKNFGFNNLSLVKPRDGWPNTKARMTSVGAYDIVKSAKVFNNVEESIKNFDIVLATSARNRDIQKKYISLDQFGNFIKKYNNSNIGILFGPESSGLSNHDLSLANFIIQIPTSNKLTSLNLSHALIVVCFEIFKHFSKKTLKKNKSNNKSASKKDIQNLIKFLEQHLDQKRFFKPPEKKKSMILNINNIFGRLELSDKEMRILFSIFSSLSKKH